MPPRGKAKPKQAKRRAATTVSNQAQAAGEAQQTAVPAAPPQPAPTPALARETMAPPAAAAIQSEDTGALSAMETHDAAMVAAGNNLIPTTLARSNREAARTDYTHDATAGQFQLGPQSSAAAQTSPNLSSRSLRPVERNPHTYARAVPSPTSDDLEYLDVSTSLIPSDAASLLSTPSDNSLWPESLTGGSSEWATNTDQASSPPTTAYGGRRVSGISQRHPQFTQPERSPNLGRTLQPEPQMMTRGRAANMESTILSSHPERSAQRLPSGRVPVNLLNNGADGSTPLRPATARSTRSTPPTLAPASHSATAPVTMTTARLTAPTRLVSIPEDTTAPAPPQTSRAAQTASRPLRSEGRTAAATGLPRTPLAELAVYGEEGRETSGSQSEEADTDVDADADEDGEADEDGAADEDPQEADKENNAVGSNQTTGNDSSGQAATSTTMIRVPLHQYVARRADRPSSAAGWIVPSSSYEVMRNGWILVNDPTDPLNAPADVVERTHEDSTGTGLPVPARQAHSTPSPRASGSTLPAPPMPEAPARASRPMAAHSIFPLPFAESVRHRLSSHPEQPVYQTRHLGSRPASLSTAAGEMTTMSSQLTPMALSSPAFPLQPTAGSSSQPPPTSQPPILTPVPEDGYPLVHRDDPEALIEGLDAERIRQWWQQPLENTVILQLFGEGYPRPGQARLLTEQITQAVRGYTSESNFVVAAPERSWQSQGNGSRTSPSAWCIQGLSPQAVLLLTERRIWSSPTITIMAYRRALTFPRFLMTVQGFAHNTNNDIETTVRATIMSEQFLAYTAQLVQLNPVFRSLNARDFATSILQNAEVRVLSFQNTNIVANIFIDSPTNSMERWREWRDVLSHLPFSSPINTTGWARRLPACRGCHGADHPTHMCPFPELPDWHGRSMTPIIPQFGPPMSGPQDDDQTQQGNQRGTRRHRDEEDGDDDGTYWRDRQVGGSRGGGRRGNLRGGRRGCGGF